MSARKACSIRRVLTGASPTTLKARCRATTMCLSGVGPTDGFPRALFGARLEQIGPVDGGQMLRAGAEFEFRYRQSGCMPRTFNRLVESSNLSGPTTS